MTLNQLVAEFSFCTPSAPPLTYTFKLTKYHFLHGEGGGPQVVRKNSAELTAAPIDVAFVGIGENGHLAFKRSTGRFPNRGTLSHAQKEERQSLKVQDFER